MCIRDSFLTDDFPEILHKEISQFKNIDVQYKLVNTKFTDNDNISIGKLSKQQMMTLFQPYINSTFYLSGASIFNKSLRQKLINIGVDKQSIFREMFG